MYVYLIVMIVCMLLEYALRPKPPDAKPATLSDFSIPVVEEGKPVAVVFGEVWVDDANVLWYGDMASAPIKSGGKK